MKHEPSALEYHQHAMKGIGKICNAQLRYRFGSSTSYLRAESRGPKLNILSMGGSKPHASRQLGTLRPAPSALSQSNLHPLGGSGRTSPGPGRGLVDVLNMETYVSFHRLDRSFEDGEKSRRVPSSGGDATMPFHC